VFSYHFDNNHYVFYIVANCSRI